MRPIRFVRFLRDDAAGATMVETGLLIALIAITLIAGGTLMGDEVFALFVGVAAEIAKIKLP
jgi:Flp pilus assembly pilin Flp